MGGKLRRPENDVNPADGKSQGYKMIPFFN
jgi:hypothetical protein